ncbi:MAG: 16S rRNA (guanine(966)-N(2))-methyltransferase RsmD [Bacteroidetes bacterium]|nr:16S rRNA (guanine(966)-N(2))-methyltransferase RsmD [Bacteroidota bacterium]
MRIIHGKFQGFKFPAYTGSNTRPTTDLVKESLFNTLENFVHFDRLRVLDVFAGTGNIGLEFLSRGALEVLSVDHNDKNRRYMKEIQKQLNIDNWTIVKSDALKFVKSNSKSYDLIFADPPYDLPNLHEFVQQLLEADWFKLNPESLFVLEHADRLVFNNKHVILKKQYGNTSFTLFKPVNP